MLRFDAYADIPGLQVAVETYEAEVKWFSDYLAVIAIAYITPGTIDSGNSPNYELRPGLLLGRQIATSQYTNYSPTATDGSEVASGVLITALRMQDFQGVNQPKFYGILVGGPVQAGKILGLDNNARMQMASHFFFDDDYNGLWFGDWRRQIPLTANYTALATDNGTLFNNTGAGGAVTVTLPPIANGYKFGIKAIANQNFAITSNEGANIVADNNASASTLTLSTVSHIIGGGVLLFTNPGGTKWISVYYGAGTSNTVTVS